MVEGLPVLNTFLNWRGLLTALLSLVLVLPAAQVHAASKRKPEEARKVSRTVSKAAQRAPKAVARTKTANSKQRVAARKSSRVVATARKTTRVARATVRPASVQRVSMNDAGFRPSYVRRVNVHAEGASAADGRTIIASPQLATSARMSFGQLYGLHNTTDPLALKSSVALVIDQDTDEVLLSKNSEAVLPIASLTKLMTALLVVEARQPMDDVLEITQGDVDTEKNSSSKLAVGTVLTRGEALHLALMSSENRAAHALGRYYPGGLEAFVKAMNQKCRQLGMFDSHFVDPTGLNSQNQSSARDLATLVKAASQKSLIRELSVSMSYVLQAGSRFIQFNTTNSLVKDPTWDIGLQKTGYIVEAGRCLVMQARMAGRRLIMVFLDSSGKYSRLADAERVRRWVEGDHSERLPRTTSSLAAAKSSS